MSYPLDYTDLELFDDLHEQIAIYRSLAPATAQYFSLLDYFVHDELFYNYLSDRGVEKLMKHHLHLGDIIDLSLEQNRTLCHLSERDMLALHFMLMDLGLDFKTDTSAWQIYRKDKPPHFCLKPLKYLPDYFADQVRAHFTRYPSPSSPEPN
ncbi:MAG: hypothetical protein KGI97_02790 [Alphaproteobacteria bacterium]|nr:hypothetical protein [Alphaproteobacteria bacterium]